MKHLTKFIMVFASGLSKISPLLFGYYLVSSFGEAAYSSFVLLMNYSAAVTAAGSLGAAPQILRAAKTESTHATIMGAALSGILIVSATLLCSGIFWSFLSERAFFPLLTQSRSEEVLVVTVFCFAILVMSLSNAIFSQQQKWGRLALSYATVYYGAVIAGVLVGITTGIVILSLTAYSVTFLLLSMVSLWWAKCKAGIAWKVGFCKLSATELIQGILKSLKVSFFGIATLCGFYFYSAYINRELIASEAAAYSIAFQLFSITIFIPSVLGSIMVPLLSQRARRLNNSLDTSKNSGLLIYVGVSVVFASMLCFFSGDILAFYGLASGALQQKVVFFMQLGAVLSATSAYFVQQNIVSGSYGVLSFGTACWLCVILTAIWFHVSDILVLSWFFVAAYLVLNLVYFFSSYLRKRQRVEI
ncbi:hypothetical protein [Halopseudomonas laoshanensis]|uniref:hypothetical protein n=1 Tax=Halopseudomonas laoshanensis TaxID=2268758 RepID=UPI0037367004